MAHPLPLRPPDLRRQARWVRRVATSAAPGHGKPMENASHSAAHPGDPADARPVRTRAPATASGAGRWPPAPAASGYRPPWSPEERFASPAGWASSPLPPTCCRRRCSGCGEQPGDLGQHATIDISTPRGRDVLTTPDEQDAAALTEECAAGLRAAYPDDPTGPRRCPTGASSRWDRVTDDSRAAGMPMGGRAARIGRAINRVVTYAPPHPGSSARGQGERRPWRGRRIGAPAGC
jgi:hypothetical protein